MIAGCAAAQPVAPPPVVVARSTAAAPRAPRKYFTIAHDILDMESPVAPVDPSMYALLDSIIDETRARIDSAHPAGGFENDDQRRLYATSVLMCIDDVLINHNFIYPRRGEDVHLLSDGLTPRHLDAKRLNDLLDQDENARRRGRLHSDQPVYVIDCDLICFVYLGVGEVLGLPVSMVEVPRHNFIRWHLSPVEYLNWETVYGLERSDESFARLYFRSIDDFTDLAGRGIFFTGMDRTQVLGYSHLLRGETYEELGDYDLAMSDYRRAIFLYPQSAAARGHLAWLLLTCEQTGLRDPWQGVILAEQAVQIWPSAALLDILACAYAQTSQFPTAAATEARAFALDPNPQYQSRQAAFARGLNYFDYLKEKAKKI